LHCVLAVAQGRTPGCTAPAPYSHSKGRANLLVLRIRVSPALQSEPLGPENQEKNQQAYQRLIRDNPSSSIVNKILLLTVIRARFYPRRFPVKNQLN